MLSAPELPQFRPQNNGDYGDFNTLKNGIFLAANHYPVQSPGYTAHWSSESLQIVERIGETAKVVSEFHVKDVSANGSIFDVTPFGERRRRKRNGGGGMLKSLTGWLKSWSNGPKMEDSIEIVQVIPLMFDSTLFDIALILKNRINNINFCYGVMRLRLLKTGNFKNITRLDGIVPGLMSGNELCKFVTWKSFLIAVHEGSGRVQAIDLGSVEGEWKELSMIGCKVDEMFICEDRNKERAVLLLQSANDTKILWLKEHLGVGDLKQEVKISAVDIKGGIQGGYLEKEDELFVIQGSNLIKVSFDEGINDQSLIPETLGDTIISYLIPWRQDFKMSALLVQLKRSAEQLYRICVVSLNSEMQGEIILESDWFASENEIVSVFASSSLEIFLLDCKGKVEIYSGLLRASHWDHAMATGNSVNFEFSQWFNILGEFPFKSAEFYAQRRKEIGGPLLIDKLLLEGDVEFPPEDWKSLGRACGRLKDCGRVEVILYYLLASSNDGNFKNKSAFYYQFGLRDQKVAFIEAAFYSDHGQASLAGIQQYICVFSYCVGKIFCTRRMEEGDRALLSSNLVTSYAQSNIADLAVFSLFAAGRLISLDVLIDSPRDMFTRMIEAILVERGVTVGLDWVKGLFAWLRPDEQSALIPVATLHQQLIKQVLAVLLKFEDNGTFKRYALDFVNASFDAEMLRSILKYLSEEEAGDRAAWMITMLCALRPKLFGFLAEFEFAGMVRDEEVLRGIEEIKKIVRPLMVGADSDSVTDVMDIDMDEESCVRTPKKTPGRLESTISNSTSSHQRVQVYTRSPRSQQLFVASSPPNSPTFVPRHFPPKKPTTLSEAVVKERGSDLMMDRLDSEKVDMVGGKRVREELIEMNKMGNKRIRDVDDDEDVCPVILTKGISDDTVFESVIKIEGKQRTKRRKRN